jgi:hypothetical protein
MKKAGRNLEHQTAGAVDGGAGLLRPALASPSPATATTATTATE